MDNKNFFKSLPKVSLIENRESLILDYCRDKNVLNLGCVGNRDLQRELKDKSLFHLKIQSVAKRLTGVDINKTGIEYLSKNGIQDLIVLDVEKLSRLKPDIFFDVIIAGEVVEHLSNPGQFLDEVSKLLDKNSNEAILIASVPNAFSLRANFSVFFAKTEPVLSDHHFYFSYITLKSLFEKHGFDVKKAYVYSDLKNEGKLKKLAKKIFNRTFLKFSPFSAEGLIVIAQKSKG